MSIKIRGASSGNIAEVDSNNNLKVNLPTVVDQAGFAVTASEVDPGAVTGSRLVRPSDTSDDYRLRVGLDAILFQDQFNAAAVNTGNWSTTLTTFTNTFSGGYSILNGGSSTATSAVANVKSYRFFPVYGTFPLYVEVWAMYAAPAVQANNTTEIGIGLSATNAAPTDGCFFRWNSTGQFRCVTVNNSAELTSGVLTSPTVNVRHHFLIVINFDSVEYWVDGVLQYRQTFTTQGMPISALNQPVTYRTYNDTVSSPANAVQLKVSGVTVSIGDMGASRPWNVIMAGNGAGAYQGQTGDTMGSTANWANSAAPANSAALANATAGYATLGGQFRFAAVGGAETDYLLFSYLLVAGTAAVPGKNMYITGIRIDIWNEVVAVATTTTVFQWGLGVGGTQISLTTVTADTATAKAARRIPIGCQWLPVGAVVGQTATPAINVQFQVPIFAENGTYVQIILKMPTATATATEYYRGTVAIDGFWE